MTAAPGILCPSYNKAPYGVSACLMTGMAQPPLTKYILDFSMSFGHRSVAAVISVISMFAVVVVRDLAQVNHREHDEDKRL